MKKIKSGFGKKLLRKGLMSGGASRRPTAPQSQPSSSSSSTDELKAARDKIADLENRLLKAEINLKKCLEEKETARLEATRAIFEALSVKQASFDTFIADAQRTFDKITAMQGDRAAIHDIATISLELISKIKAEALDMGLLSFGNYLQQFADTIKEIGQQKTPTFSEELRLIAQMEQILQEKDKLVEIVEKLRAVKPAQG
ncbi:MAG: hypothetical protein Ta2A_21590 [Treponemataceae bacterium]|nr:MAG: hypothetical protein Ta2A_21590 [Treponemataceae bacterium]